METNFKESDIIKQIYSIDDFDYSSVKHSDEVRTCAVCGKEFYPVGRNGWRQRYCNRSHYLNCLICGKPVLQDPPSDKIGGIKRTCKGQCENKFKMMKTSQAIKAKYGYDNISQVPEFKKKISDGIKAKAPETTAKIKKIMEEKYGGMGTASPIIREKIEKTTLERYGVKNPSYNDEVRQKISEANSSPEVIAKYEETAMARWGVTRPSKTKEVQDKMKQTTLEKYGVECALQTDYAKGRLEEASMEKYGVPNPLISDYGRARSREAIIENRRDHYNKISRINQSVADKLREDYGIETEFEWYVGKKSYDLIVSGTNILIEIDPSYTHSIIASHWAEGKSQTYHLERTQIAEEAGYRCIHIFDWDDPDKIGSMLRPVEKVYARKCSISKMDTKKAKQFINEYHIQGDARGAKIAYGLFLNNELISVMTFGVPRYNKKYEWELLRLCTKSGYQVLGGPSKLFKHFIEENNPQSIISYCDKAKFTGSVYTRMGMTLHHQSEPAKIWSKGTHHITDNLLRQRGYDQLFNTNFGKGTSNEVLMLDHGWLPVYDCGQMVFEWIQS